MFTNPHHIRLFVLCLASLLGGPTVVAAEQRAESEAFAALNGYRLTAKDAVHIKVFQEDELETTTRIGKDGTIAFPLLGSAKIGGLTVQDATATMEKLLREYLVKPQVALTIVDYSKRRITILGTVTKPGTYDLPDDATVNLLEAVGMAGGFSRISNQKVTIKRLVEGKQTIIKLDVKKMQKEEGSPRFEVLPGDTIVVDESFW